MTKPFPPGTDRLAALPHHDSGVSGCPVLKAAHATMDCTVVSDGSSLMGGAEHR